MVTHTSNQHDPSTRDATAAARVLISGSTGLVGSALRASLSAAGHTCSALVRQGKPSDAGDVPWDADAGSVDRDALAAAQPDVVVHLAGESIAAGRWTEARKKRLRDSRIVGTRAIAEAIAELPRRPRVLLCASAIGYYGPQRSDTLTEASEPGNDFLANLCRDWEAATQPAAEAGIRTVHLRFGVILSPRGGALAKMLTPFKLGVGGVIGSGEQVWSWISLDDAVAAIEHAIHCDALQGPANVVTPQPVTNRQFTKTLGCVLSRPTILPMPAFAARLAFGEMADALLLASQRVEPTRLLDTGFTFKHPQLEAALRSLLHA